MLGNRVLRRTLRDTDCTRIEMAVMIIGSNDRFLDDLLVLRENAATFSASDVQMSAERFQEKLASSINSGPLFRTCGRALRANNRQPK